MPLFSGTLSQLKKTLFLYFYPNFEANFLTQFSFKKYILVDQFTEKNVFIV